MEYLNLYKLLNLPRKKAKREVKVFFSTNYDRLFNDYVDLLWWHFHKNKSFNREYRYKTRWFFDLAGYDDDDKLKLPSRSKLSKIIDESLKDFVTDQSVLTPHLDFSQPILNNSGLDYQSPFESLVHKFYSSLTITSDINIYELSEKIFHTNKFIHDLLIKFHKHLENSCTYIHKQIRIFLFRDMHRLNPEPSDDHSDKAYLFKICKLHFIGMIYYKAKSWNKKNMSLGITQIIMSKLTLQTSNQLLSTAA